MDMSFGELSKLIAVEKKKPSLLWVDHFLGSPKPCKSGQIELSKRRKKAVQMCTCVFISLCF